MQRIADESLKRIETRMQGSEAALARALSQNETRMEALRVTLEEGARLMREENAQKLNEMRQTVDEKLSATLEKRLTASFSQVSERLEQVYHVIKKYIMERFRLTILAESRIRWKMYVRFGGEYWEKMCIRDSVCTGLRSGMVFGSTM